MNYKAGKMYIWDTASLSKDSFISMGKDFDPRFGCIDSYSKLATIYPNDHFFVVALEHTDIGDIAAKVLNKNGYIGWIYLEHSIYKERLGIFNEL